MNKKSPRERRHQRTRTAILTTAIELIREKGADKLSLREIARRIDYSPAGLYEYFGSKDEIIESICTEGNIRLSSYMAQVDDSLPFETYIFELGKQYIRFAVEDSDYFMLMFSRMLPNAPDMSEEDFLSYKPDRTDSFSYAYYAVEQAVVDGIIQIRDDQPVIHIAVGFWGVVHGLAMLRVTHLADYPIDFEMIERTTIETFLQGLRIRNQSE